MGRMDYVGLNMELRRLVPHQRPPAPLVLLCAKLLIKIHLPFTSYWGEKTFNMLSDRLLSQCELAFHVLLLVTGKQKPSLSNPYP